MYLIAGQQQQHTWILGTIPGTMPLVNISENENENKWH